MRGMAHGHSRADLLRRLSLEHCFEVSLGAVVRVVQDTDGALGRDDPEPHRSVVAAACERVAVR